MTEQWLLLQAELRNLMTVIAEAEGPIKWLFLLAYKILDFMLWVHSKIVR